MLATLEKAYGCPVDTEFTTNSLEEEDYKINLVQCRPLQVAGARLGEAADLPADIDHKNLILEARGAVIGQSRLSTVDRLVYVVPSVYGHLPIPERYAVARLIGRVMHAEEPRRPERVMLLGPGRWGTTTPSLGVPVSFAEINTISALCEIVAMREDLVPDVSLGTHFFNELVEMDILYLALFPAVRAISSTTSSSKKPPTAWRRSCPRPRTGHTWFASLTPPTCPTAASSSLTRTTSASGRLLPLP